MIVSALVIGVAVFGDVAVRSAEDSVFDRVAGAGPTAFQMTGPAVAAVAMWPGAAMAAAFGVVSIIVAAVLVTPIVVTPIIVAAVHVAATTAAATATGVTSSATATAVTLCHDSSGRRCRRFIGRRRRDEDGRKEKGSEPQAPPLRMSRHLLVLRLSAGLPGDPQGAAGQNRVYGDAFGQLMTIGTGTLWRNSITARASSADCTKSSMPPAVPSVQSWPSKTASMSTSVTVS